ncbi:MAG: uracil phosphoribosyltransferase [Gammaproteobacteria bacterium]|jgi:uracil phosphoribosyltransferase|nr:uracil phosphoribosyltransferase [Gammaproteobacteria bacterium]
MKIPQTLIQHPNFKHFFTVNHPLVLHKLSILRDKDTDQQAFRDLVKEITTLLVYEVTRHLTVETISVETPLKVMKSPRLSGKTPVILPILRAGLGMVDGFLSLMPTAKVGHIGLYRNEKTLKPVFYYFKIPKDNAQRCYYVCDPMLATGGSAVEAINRLKQEGIRDITFVCLVAAPEGVECLCRAHPDLPIYAAALDEGLNADSYIVPGLGDAGDRLFGTS